MQATETHRSGIGHVHHPDFDFSDLRDLRPCEIVLVRMLQSTRFDASHIFTSTQLTVDSSAHQTTLRFPGGGSIRGDSTEMDRVRVLVQKVFSNREVRPEDLDVVPFLTYREIQMYVLSALLFSTPCMFDTGLSRLVIGSDIQASKFWTLDHEFGKWYSTLLSTFGFVVHAIDVDEFISDSRTVCLARLIHLEARWAKIPFSGCPPVRLSHDRIAEFGLSLHESLSAEYAGLLVADEQRSHVERVVDDRYGEGAFRHMNGYRVVNLKETEGVENFVSNGARYKTNLRYLTPELLDAVYIRFTTHAKSRLNDRTDHRVETLNLRRPNGWQLITYETRSEFQGVPITRVGDKYYSFGHPIYLDLGDCVLFGRIRWVPEFDPRTPKTIKNNQKASKRSKFFYVIEPGREYSLLIDVITTLARPRCRVYSTISPNHGGVTLGEDANDAEYLSVMLALNDKNTCAFQIEYSGVDDQGERVMEISYLPAKLTESRPHLSGLEYDDVPTLMEVPELRSFVERVIESLPRDSLDGVFAIPFANDEYEVLRPIDGVFTEEQRSKQLQQLQRIILSRVTLVSLERGSRLIPTAEISTARVAKISGMYNHVPEHAAVYQIGSQRFAGKGSAQWRLNSEENPWNLIAPESPPVIVTNLLLHYYDSSFVGDDFEKEVVCTYDIPGFAASFSDQLLTQLNDISHGLDEEHGSILGFRTPFCLGFVFARYLDGWDIEPLHFIWHPSKTALISRSDVYADVGLSGLVRNDERVHSSPLAALASSV